MQWTKRIHLKIADYNLTFNCFLLIEAIEQDLRQYTYILIKLFWGKNHLRNAKDLHVK